MDFFKKYLWNNNNDSKNKDNITDYLNKQNIVITEENNKQTIIEPDDQYTSDRNNTIVVFNSKLYECKNGNLEQFTHGFKLYRKYKKTLLIILQITLRKKNTYSMRRLVK